MHADSDLDFVGISSANFLHPPASFSRSSFSVLNEFELTSEKNYLQKFNVSEFHGLYAVSVLKCRLCLIRRHPEKKKTGRLNHPLIVIFPSGNLKKY